ncbi:hypothetical protein NEUTE2DRAFT_73689 [Neurospora tetrasperma FGSC 2509]|nr:hypothetical protein NEUTE2DRAFT_73689 [Neurospora tetrasperma FGSC 2509]
MACDWSIRTPRLRAGSRRGLELACLSLDTLMGSYGPLSEIGMQRTPQAAQCGQDNPGKCRG